MLLIFRAFAEFLHKIKKFHKKIFFEKNFKLLYRIKYENIRVPFQEFSGEMIQVDDFWCEKCGMSSQVTAKIC